MSEGKRIASFSFPEKGKILEKLRRRELQIARVRKKLKAERIKEEPE
jgi:hypothetical protein